MTGSAQDRMTGSTSDSAFRDPLLVRAALRLYPRRWNNRYQDEYAALLSELLTGASWPARLRLVTSVIAGAFDARVNFAGGMSMIDRIRRPLGVVVGALVAFTIAGAGFQKMTEDPAFSLADRQHAVIGVSFNTLRAAAAVAGLVVLASAVPLLWTIIRQAVSDHRTDMLRLLAVPPLAIVLWLLVAKLVLRIYAHFHVHQVHSARSDLVALSIFGLGWAAASLCAWATISLLRRADLPDRLLRSQLIPMIALTACMAVVTAADVTWGLAMRSGDVALFHSSNGLLASYMPPTWAIGVAVLAAATGLTGWATVRMARLLWTAPVA